MSESVSSIKRVKQALSNEPTQFVTAYVLSGVLAILIPGLKHAVTMAQYKNSYYYAYREQENQGGSGDTYDVNKCKWFNPWCQSLWYNQNGEQVEQNEDGNNYYSVVPSWISGWTSGGGGSRDDGAASSAGGLKFVYAWQMILFLGLLAYGALTLFKYRGNLAQSRVALQSLWLLIFVFGNFSFLSMWMLANGSIYTSGRELENIGGFYHQFSVMMFITNFWYVLWSIVFGTAVGMRISRNNKEQEEASNSYLPYSEPTTTETGIVNPPSIY